MKKRYTLVLMLVASLTATVLSRGGGRYNFPTKVHKQDIIKELDKRLRIVDSNLVFDDHVLTITLPGPKGDKGETGMVGLAGLPGIAGKDGVSIQGPSGRIPAHEWDDTRLRFQMPDQTWGPYTDLLGPFGRLGYPGIGGLNGTNGANGDRGVDGQDGAPGLDGSMGGPGPAGSDGSDGQDGKDGSNGSDGGIGPPGKDGKDAKLPPFTTMQILLDAKMRNGKLVKTYAHIQVYAQ